MRIAVMGAGAVGSYYGGMLALAGHEVTLIVRAPHADAIARAGGLVLERPGSRETVSVTAAVDATGVRGADLVLFCVKSTDTEQAGTRMAGHLAPDATVLCLQNGVDNAARLQPLLRAKVQPAVVYVASEMAGPGHVRYLGGGDLVVGHKPCGERVAALFREASLGVRVAPDIHRELWTKLTVNCAYNALSAILQLPYGRMVETAGVECAMQAVVAECLAVARGLGIELPQDLWTSVRAVASRAPNQLSSTAWDLRRGKPSEIDHLNGFVLRKAQELGKSAPTNHLLHTLVKATEEQACPAHVRKGASGQSC
jgi:2-dehydropantoate 2-reductase